MCSATSDYLNRPLRDHGQVRKEYQDRTIAYIVGPNGAAFFAIPMKSVPPGVLNQWTPDAQMLRAG